MRRRAALFSILVCGACSREQPAAQTTYYEREIAPVVQGSCASSSTRSGCHVYADDKGNAFGNLSVESYDRLALRRDLLVDYGPYGIPGLLLKSVPAYDLRLSFWDGSERTITTDISHAGGALLDFTSASFTQLERWIENGASENNAAAAKVNPALTPCSEELGTDPLFDGSSAPASDDFGRFESEVNPTLASSCAAGNCHGSPTNQLYLTCGNSPEQVRWNYFAASDYVSSNPSASEILRRTLAPAQGGTYHEGGTIFETANDANYRAILDWATAKGGASNVPADAGFAFFAERVQPMLVKRGCMMLGCHSPAMFHDYRLRGGSGGHFGLPAVRTNYRLSIDQLALESDDPNASRLVRKNLIPALGGLRHRGGALFSSGGDPAACDLTAAETGPLDAQDPYCVLVAWIKKERQARAADVAPLSAIVYVRRPGNSAPDRAQDFADYRPGAALIRRAANIGADGTLTVSDNEEDLSARCGLGAGADIRRPAVSWDGARIAFAARGSESDPLRIYVIEGDSCALESAIDAPAVDERGQPVPTNGELVHNFDPAFAADGRIVFTSTRGNIMNNDAFDYAGPQRTPADPSKLNANLYVLEDGKIRQLTFLLNQELSPSFMNDGRVILVAEKRAPGFYQLAGRRINLDGGDYHPLFGQRSTIGYTQLTDLVELADKNFAAILSERGAAHGSGALAIINRSLGVDQGSSNPDDFVQRPDALDWPNPDFYQRSLTIVDPAATGKLAGTRGAYRNPSPLPDGQLLVSYDKAVSNLSEFASNFGVYVVNPSNQERRALFDGPADELWPVAVYGRAARHVFRSRRDEVNGATRILHGADERPYSQVTFMDLPLLSSLLFQNTRGPERVMADDDSRFEFWESMPPAAGVTDFASGGAFITQDNFGPLYVRRRPLGSLTPEHDGSAKVLLRGGVPVVLATEVQLTGDQAPVRHFQREEMQFYPGEWSHQSFKRDLFNGLCAGCHGSVEGQESHIAIQPDILTRASDVAANKSPARVLTPNGAPEGPEFP